MELGATDDGKPGPRPQYGDAYYAAFVRDLDGHKIEAMFWDETKGAELG
jgi:predicted lactoylglutathione lyase